MTPKRVYQNKNQSHSRLQAEDAYTDKENEPLQFSTPKRKRRLEENEDTPKCKKLKRMLALANKKLKQAMMINKSLKKS